MKHAGQLSMIALTLVAMGAAAQNIEISSPSIGRVVVAPPRIDGAATSAIPPGARDRANVRGGTGVDLGIQRRSDGTLYDALDPNQNPAAAAPSTLSPRNRDTSGEGPSR